MTEARIEVVDDDIRFPALSGASGEFAGGVYLEKLGDLISANSLGGTLSVEERLIGEIPINHVGGLFVV